MKIFPDEPPCEWLCMRYRDKRSGFFWYCQWCRYMTRSRKEPDCALPKDTNE